MPVLTRVWGVFYARKSRSPIKRQLSIKQGANMPLPPQIKIWVSIAIQEVQISKTYLVILSKQSHKKGLP
jgi:hypothetical protein